MMTVLERPRLELFPSYLQFMSEMQAAGEKIWEGRIPKPDEIPEAFVARLIQDETAPGPSLVPATTYWASLEGTVVGSIQLRHHLNDALKEYGGHTGYEVRPSYRRRGIATEMLKQLLTTERARQIGRLLVTCAPDNIASNKTIIANGGVLADTRYVERIQRQTHYYWIDLQ